MAAKWFVEITGDQFLLNILSQKLIDSNAQIIKEGAKFYITSNGFEHLQNANIVNAQAEQLVENIASICDLLLGENTATRLRGRVIEVLPDGTKKSVVYYKTEPGRATMRAYGEGSLSCMGVVIDSGPSSSTKQYKVLSQGSIARYALFQYKKTHHWQLL